MNVRTFKVADCDLEERPAPAMFEVADCDLKLLRPFKIAICDLEGTFPAWELEVTNCDFKLSGAFKVADCDLKIAEVAGFPRSMGFLAENLDIITEWLGWKCGQI